LESLPKRGRSCAMRRRRIEVSAGSTGVAERRAWTTRVIEQTPLDVGYGVRSVTRGVRAGRPARPARRTGPPASQRDSLRVFVPPLLRVTCPFPPRSPFPLQLDIAHISAYK